ncbi:MAG: DUF309 domain-containing protein [Cyanobium sp.]
MSDPSGWLEGEQELIGDVRFQTGVRLFNAGDWYPCHDAFEAVWMETAGPLRPVLQAFLQCAVSQLHLERGNRRGATLLLGEALGRLPDDLDSALGIRLRPLREGAAALLAALQLEQDETNRFRLVLEPVD